MEFVHYDYEIKWACFFFKLLENDTDQRQYAIKGGNTIMGYLFAYQEKTGMGIEQIMKTPWLMIVLGMMTAPSVDYREGKSKNEKVTKPKTVDEQMNALNQIFS